MGLQWFVISLRRLICLSAVNVPPRRGEANGTPMRGLGHSLPNWHQASYSCLPGPASSRNDCRRIELACRTTKTSQGLDLAPEGASQLQAGLRPAISQAGISILAPQVVTTDCRSTNHGPPIPLSVSPQAIPCQSSPTERVERFALIGHFALQPTPHGQLSHAARQSRPRRAWPRPWRGRQRPEKGCDSREPRQYSRRPRPSLRCSAPRP